MRQKLENYVKSHYTDVRIWEYSEAGGECYLRFTSEGKLYLMSMLKAGSHATIFKGEANILI